MRLSERVFMAMGVAAVFRRLARAAVCLLAGTLALSAAAGAQATCGTAKTPPCVNMGSLIPIPINTGMNQIYKMVFYKGNVLALDAGNSTMYQLAPGATQWSRLLPTFGIFGSAFNTQGMAIDAQGTLYISDGYPSSTAPNALFWRVPASCTTASNATCNTANWNAPGNSYTWNISTANAWGGNIIDPITGKAIYIGSSEGTQDVQWKDSPAMDGSGTLYFTTSQGEIFMIAVNNQGQPTSNGNTTNPTATAIAYYMAQNAGNSHMAVDGAGNIFYIAGHAIPYLSDTGGNCVRQPGTTGIFFIPAGVTAANTPGLANGSGAKGQVEAYLQSQGWRVDYTQEGVENPEVYAGVTLDAAGNLYMTSETNSGYCEIFAGTWEIPNVCGAPPTASNLNQCMAYSDVSLLAAIPGNQPVTVDSRGYLWLTPYETYAPNGEATQSNVYALGVLAPGVINLNYGLGASSAQMGEPTGVPGAAGVPGSAQIGYVAFNGTFQPTDFQFSSASGGTYTITPGGASGTSPLNLTLTNPLLSSSQTPPTEPCNFVSTTTKTFTTYSSTGYCYVWVTLNPNVPGPVSGELTIYGNESTTTNGVTTVTPQSYSAYVNGTGQGAGVAMLNSPQLNTLAAFNVSDPPAQVASDPIGDTWVAVPGLNQVQYFPAASSSTPWTSSLLTAPLTDPTGVAVDGAGDVYIADYNSSQKVGKVWEIPWVPSTTGGGYGAQAAISTKAMGLGNNLNLAVDTTGDVFIADPENARVVKIPNPAQANIIPNPSVAGDTSVPTLTIGSGFTAPSAVAVDASGDVYVADGTTLWEISAFPSGVQTEITSSLPAPATGLAVDASGSVIVALQDEGLYRIPYIASCGGPDNLCPGSASLIDTSVNVPGPSTINPACNCPDNSFNTYAVNIVNPNGVALDQQGNIYVTDIDPTAGPNLYQLNVNGFVDYGVGLTTTVADEQDVDLFNIGNEPLNLTGTPAFSGQDALLGYYSLTTPIGTPVCGASTAVPAGESCSLGPTFTPPALPPTDVTPSLYTGDMLSVPTNASNIEASANAAGGGTATATLQAASVNNLETTTTQAVVNYAQQTYPGSVTVTVNIAGVTSGTYVYPNNSPTGTVVLTVTCATAGCTQPAIVETAPAQVAAGATGTNIPTSASFSLTSLDGGNYNVTAQYEGSVLNLMAKSSGSTSLSINTATPVITLSQPSGITPNATNGVSYVPLAGAITLTANVSSTVGSPTGTVTLWNNPTITNGVCSAGSGGTDEGTATFVSNQNWTFSTVGLAAGPYNLIACYSGDENYSPIATTTAVSFQDIPPSALITAKPTSLTITAGTPVQATLTVQSLVGFSAPTGANIICAFTAANSPPYYSECTFNVPQPAICAPGAGVTCTPAQTVLTFTTNIPVNIPPGSTAQRARPLGPPLALAGLFGLGLLGLALRRRAVFNRYLLNLLCLALFFAGTVMGITSCTNSGYTKTPPTLKVTTPANTYNVSIEITNSSTGVVESLPFVLPITVNAQ